MSTTNVQPATTPIPVQLSAHEFDGFLLPHLSMPRRGPKCKLGYHRVFNLILWGLYTGMQCKCLPVPQDPAGKPAIHYMTVYKVASITKPCHHFLYSGGEFARLYPVNPTPTRNYAAKTKRRPRVRSKSALDIGGLMSVPYSRLKAPRM